MLATPCSSASPAPTLSAARPRSGAEEAVCSVAVCAVSEPFWALRGVVAAPAGGRLKIIEVTELTVGREAPEDSVRVALSTVYEAMRAG